MYSEQLQLTHRLVETLEVSNLKSMGGAGGAGGAWGGGNGACISATTLLFIAGAAGVPYPLDGAP